MCIYTYIYIYIYIYTCADWKELNPCSLMPPLSKAEMLEIQPDASNPDGIFTKCAIHRVNLKTLTLTLSIYLFIYLSVYLSICV